MNTDQLEELLRHDVADLGHPDLARVRREGTRLRTRRRAGVAAGVALGLVAGALGWGLTGPGAADRGGRVATEAPLPTSALSGQALRALAEVPGAVQVSPTQVVIPGPDRPARKAHKMEPLFAANALELPGHVYHPVTAYPPGVLPAWLDDESVIVDAGPAYLGCQPMASGGTCVPVLLSKVGDLAYVEQMMWAEHLGRAGSETVVATRDDYSTGRPRVLVVAVADQGVARAEFRTADGELTGAELDDDDLAPTDTVMWANVHASPTDVLTYDADGRPRDREQLLPCGSPSICAEVP